MSKRPSKNNISLLGAHRIIVDGSSSRVDDDAAEELRVILERIGISISKQAAELAHHAGRKTVKPSDISLATTMVFGKKV